MSLQLTICLGAGRRDLPRFPILGPASCVVRTNAASGREDDDVVLGHIAARTSQIYGLHNHRLPLCGARRPLELEALAAIATIGTANRSETVGHSVRRWRRDIGIAEEASAVSLTTRRGAETIFGAQRVVVDIADLR